MEKIADQIECETQSKKHLHIRGENARSTSSSRYLAETPPHTWRKFCPSPSKSGDSRNTSTYVEKIGSLHVNFTIRKKHLHIRGENHIGHGMISVHPETPPHTWRKFVIWRCNRNLERNTSTYVEKITAIKEAQSKEEKHLHIRGENLKICVN